MLGAADGGARIYLSAPPRHKEADGGALRDDAWDLVFCRPDGRPIGKRGDWADWKEVLRRAGVRDVRVHDGRHTAGTLLAEPGVDPRTIQQVLGHSQMSRTARYIHASNELTRGAVQRMGEALWD